MEGSKGGGRGVGERWGCKGGVEVVAETFIQLMREAAALAKEVARYI